MILSEHVWKIGDWASFHTDRYLIVGVEENVVSVIDRSLRVHTNLLKSRLVHLPDCDSWTWQPPATLQLKEGCWYERRDGMVVGPARPIDNGSEFKWAVGVDHRYKDNGRWISCETNCGFDLIREVPPPTLQLREGAWYERRDGKIVGPLVSNKVGGQFSYMQNSANYWVDKNGCFYDTKECDYDLIREVPAPTPKYRPFANAEEFKPHADKWIRWDWKGKVSICRVAVYGDDCLTLCNAAGSHSWTDAFNGYTFLDGTPFGVKVDE